MDVLWRLCPVRQRPLSWAGSSACSGDKASEAKRPGIQHGQPPRNPQVVKWASSCQVLGDDGVHIVQLHANVFHLKKKKEKTSSRLRSALTRISSNKPWYLNQQHMMYV
ncbi:hypothetical protein AAFF_G00327640 [Aldrovandia affinis]|uniref:Uncharacterized protein n=1 Tax=Aldrovandia affinis TaxID=143900 RepID=A0AAD7TB51_9TELE|nr:hypothetical protein AAFF_G00327640 [Aldrovandia affinis]